MTKRKSNKLTIDEYINIGKDDIIVYAVVAIIF